MENVGFSERKSVINVLTQGKELANELKRLLHPTKTSREACNNLVESILSSYENALALLALLQNGDSSQFSVSNLLESPQSFEGSEGSDQNSKDQLQKLKKRKALPRWSEQVRVRSATGFESQLDDGYNWRKYGQKDILGTNHPRAYYRCTHRNTQGCLATKQVQRADDDPTVVEVIYRGKHSCRQERLKQNKEKREKESPRQSKKMMIVGSEPVLKNEIQDLDFKEEHFLSFSFPSTPIESENVEPQFFPEPSNFIATSNPSPFLSPATSDSYFSLSPCPVNDFGIDQSLQSSESDFAEIISNPTPFMNFPLGDLDISINQVNFSSELRNFPLGDLDISINQVNFSSDSLNSDFLDALEKFQ